MNFSRCYRNRGKAIYGFDPNIILLEYKKKETARSVIYTIDDAIKKIEEMDDDEEESDE